jgi:hypothetical protein
MDQIKKRHHFFPFEHRHQPLLPKDVFFRRLIYAALLDILIVAAWVVIGIIGYKLTVPKMSWMNAFLNAAMIAGGMGPIYQFKRATEIAKLFGGLYAIMSGILILTVFGILAAPIFHRFLHRFHLDGAEEDVDQEK